MRNTLNWKGLRKDIKLWKFLTHREHATGNTYSEKMSFFILQIMRNQKYTVWSNGDIFKLQAVSTITHYVWRINYIVIYSKLRSNYTDQIYAVLLTSS
jgi:hypothetical protein